METSQKILDAWKKDSKVDRFHPDDEVLNIGSLQQKYLQAYKDHKVNSKKIENEYKRMHRIKLKYYSGKMNQEELQTLGWDQWPYTMRKADIDKQIELDEDLITITEKKEDHELSLFVCDQILKEIMKRSYEIHDFIEWQKFMEGK